MSFRNIVIAPCGNKSYLFNSSWLKEKDARNFDLCLLFYHDQINDAGRYGEADYFYHLRDFKYHMLHQLLTAIHPEWLEQYDYFYFLDDDIEIETKDINEMFLLSRATKSAISQAALSKDSFCSWPMFKQKKNVFCRFVGQIEVMAPLFEREALKKCLPSFVGNRSSWGVDSVWPKILGYPEDRLVVFDQVVMKHTLPVGGGELYQKIGVDPHDEWKAITEAYGAKKQNYREYGRLAFVHKKSHYLLYLRIKAGELGGKIKRRWRDYDLASRIRSRWSKLFRLPKQNVQK